MTGPKFWAGRATRSSSRKLTKEQDLKAVGAAQTRESAAEFVRLVGSHTLSTQFSFVGACQTLGWGMGSPVAHHAFHDLSMQGSSVEIRVFSDKLLRAARVLPLTVS